MKTVFVHDWLIHMRGGEKVLEALAELYPDAVVYTLFCDRRKLSPVLQRMKIRTCFLQYVPGIRRIYRWLLPMLPWAVRSFRIPETDLLISSSHCVAKGARKPEGACHICYTHTPMRYIWGYEDVYFGKFPLPIRSLISFFLKGLREWDLETNKDVDSFVANSENVRSRIREFYGRDAEVIHPPLDTSFYKPDGEPGDYYLAVSAFVPYKKVDIVIEAFNEWDRSLMIVGDGPLRKRYQGLRRSNNISFLGSVQGEELRRLYSGAKALIFPTDEDFGIVPLEAQACGTPVIAYKKGGALESVRCGLFIEEQTPEALRAGILEFESKSFNRNEIAGSVASFGKETFKKKFARHAEACLNGRQKK